MVIDRLGGVLMGLGLLSNQAVSREILLDNLRLVVFGVLPAFIMSKGFSQEGA